MSYLKCLLTCSTCYRNWVFPSSCSVWTQVSLTQYPCLAKVLTRQAGKDSFLLLEICLLGLPALRFEVFFLVDLWSLKDLLRSFPNSSCRSCFLYEVVLSLGFLVYYVSLLITEMTTCSVPLKHKWKLP